MNTKEKLRGFIIENFMFGSENASLGDDDPFFDMGIIDSTGVLEVVGFIEEEFGVEVEDRELVPENFETVNKLAAYIDGKLRAKA